MGQIEGAIAAVRFGMGARPGEIAAAAGDPRGWLKAQVRAGAALIPQGELKSSAEVFASRRTEYAAMAMARPDAQMADAPGPGAGEGALSDQQRQALQKRVQEELRTGLIREADARSRNAAQTQAPFAERWARFWANHFTTAARNAQLIGLVGPYEREAVRPNVFGTFGGLLEASVLHPGMLVYLDAHRSIGPNSRAGQRREAGLNENLAREVLELHTMGVGTGYSQADIIEFAKALTGWTIAGGGRPGSAQRTGETAGAATFQDLLHEPGARVLLGKTYAEGGREQALAILKDLAARPETARHVAVKLVRHFVADDPPAASVAIIERRFRDTGGDLTQLARAVIDLDAAWTPEPRKFKTPDELLVSTARGFGQDIAYGRDRRPVYESLGQRPYGAPSPAGWPDRAADWAGPDALKKRLEWANAAATRFVRGRESPVAFLDTALGPLADARTREAVARAESAEQGFALALMSPSFQRR
jgi:uncharacterized protein (DUF1800 family)